MPRIPETTEDPKKPETPETSETTEDPETPETTEDPQLPLSKMTAIRNTTTDTLSAIVGRKRYTVLPGRTERVPDDIAALWIKRKSAVPVK